jgi:hypothetical protein
VVAGQGTRRGEPLIFVHPVDKAELVDYWDVLVRGDAAQLPGHARRHAARHLGPGRDQGLRALLGDLAPAHDWLYMNLVPTAS